MKLLKKHPEKAPQLIALASTFIAPESKVLDLACGQGHNGLFLEKQGVSLSYLDKNQQALERVRNNCTKAANIICADLETEPVYDLGKEVYEAILVFRYLHRPLFNNIKEALKMNGLIVYETFTHKQAEIGRPKNPDYLLQDNELLAQFSGYKVHHFYQGYDSRQQAYISQIIAEKI